jgi:hypothetical protein
VSFIFEIQINNLSSANEKAFIASLLSLTLYSFLSYKNKFFLSETKALSEVLDKTNHSILDIF